MKKKPTIEDEAKRLFNLWLGDSKNMNPPWDVQFKAVRLRWIRLARHVRRREKKAMQSGNEIIRILTQ